MTIMYLASLSLFFVLAISNSRCAVGSNVRHITDENFDDLLRDEWLIKFYAPWCPACQSLAPVWERLGAKAAEIGANIAEVDVTESAGLSGRFFVTALPTIYHAKDGVFRQYRKSRTDQDLTNFVVNKLYEQVDPVPWYLHPASYHMTAVSWFFEFSILIRNIHNSITEDYGVPVWVSYLGMAVLTVFIGLILGLCCVGCCDLVNRMREPHYDSRLVRGDGDMKFEDDTEDELGYESNMADDKPVSQPVPDNEASGYPASDEVSDSLVNENKPHTESIAASNENEDDSTVRHRKLLQ